MLFSMYSFGQKKKFGKKSGETGVFLCGVLGHKKNIYKKKKKKKIRIK